MERGTVDMKKTILLLAIILITLSGLVHAQIKHLPGAEHIRYPTEDPLDSFGRARISAPFAIFDAQFNYDLQPSWFQQEVLNGSIIHIPAHSAVRLSTGGTAVGNGAIFQTRNYWRYLPGMAHQIVWTCTFGDPATGVVRTAGLYDDEDGLAFVQDELGIGILRRTSTSGSPIDNIVRQADWNLDKLDGTGQSNQLLDSGSDNIFIIDFQWLGAGLVRWGFDFSGQITYCHQSQWANTEEVPFMRTANLPFRVEIENTDTADSEAIFDFTCVALNSGGGSEPFPLIRSTSNDEASGGATPLRPVTSSNEPLPILSIRPRMTFNSLISRGQVRPTSFQVTSKNAPIAYAVILNGVLTGAVFADVNTSDSIVQADVSATAIGGGIVLQSGYLGAGAGMQVMENIVSELENIVLSNNIPGDETEILSLVVSLTDGVPSDCAGAFTWEELR